MVYQQCGPLRPQTCDSNGIANCPYGCAKGCFCPYGLVTYNGRCIEPLTCPGNISVVHFILTSTFMYFIYVYVLCSYILKHLKEVYMCVLCYAVGLLSL